jgi:hypothetical protein
MMSKPIVYTNETPAAPLESNTRSTRLQNLYNPSSWIMLAAPSRPGTFVILLGVSAFVTLIVTHVLWPLALPPAWPDESHFLIPAVSFAHRGDFSASSMLTQQIYWIPNGIYVLNGVVFFLLGHVDIQLGRIVSFVCVTGAALILRHIVAVALGPLDGRRPVFGTTLVLVWYLSLPVVFAADLARPEAPLLLTSLAALDCFLRGRLVGGFAFAALSAAVHPLLALPACAVAVCALPKLHPASLPGLRATRWWEWVIGAIAAGLLATEIGRLAGDFSLYRLHMTFQLTRKAGRTVGWMLVLSAIGTITASCLAFFTSWRGTGAAMPRLSPRVQCQLVLVFGWAALLVHNMGQEMWYFPFLLLGLILILCAVLGSDFAQGTPITEGLAVLLSVVAVCAGLSTWGLGLRPRGFFALHVQPSFLESVSNDQRSLASEMHDLLIREDAKAVLVEPSLYYAFLDQRDASPRAYTWSPLSRPTDVVFDHVLVLKNSDRKDDFPQALLSAYVCMSEREMGTPGGHYTLNVMAVSHAPGTRHGFVPCATP